MMRTSAMWQLFFFSRAWRTGKSGWSSSQDVPYGPPKRLPCWKNIGAGEVCFTNRYKPRILILQVLQGRLWVGNLQGKKTQKERLGTCWNLSEVFFSELVIPWCICSEIGSEYGMTYLKWSLNIWVPWVPSHFRPFGPLEAPWWPENATWTRDDRRPCCGWAPFRFLLSDSDHPVKHCWKIHKWKI